MTREELIKRLEAGEVGREMDAEVAAALKLNKDGNPLDSDAISLEAYQKWVLVSINGRTSHRYNPPEIVASREAVTSAIRLRLPGWWYSSGDCYLTCHASIGPDHNDPSHSERLHKEFPPQSREEWDSGIHADLSQPSTEAAALMCCLLRALQIMGEQNE